MKKPTNFDQLYPGRFLKAGLFQGKKPTLTIKDADIEELEGDDGKKIKALISFIETDLQLVACKTNGLCFKSMFGPEISSWIGKRVTLFSDIWNGEDCIRVWGSPDIAAEQAVEVKLPRRKPFKMTMHKIETKPEPTPRTDLPTQAELEAAYSRNPG